ncbi:MAG: carbohydrate kinase [Bacteroidaceae bacterium]|nr:carbohydrate kinase [Bacteroidaceae bacterium]
MRKIIGIGETIMDIIFKNGQPTAAVPGGSVFNGLISLGRLGQKVTMITETGNDKVGEKIKEFMVENGIETDGVCVYEDGRTAISLAWLNDRNDAEYSFYKDYPKARLDVEWPEINKDDIVMMGSYFVLNPVLRDKVKEFLDYAKDRGALIYYDINFRSSHKDEALRLYPTILENFEYADIVRGSTEDFENMFDMKDPSEVYENKVSFYCKTMICTDADGDIMLISPEVKKTYPVEKIQTVSTIGAGDNFNAGVVYGLMNNKIRKDDINNVSENTWDNIISMGQKLAINVCQSFNNSISKELANEIKAKK